MCLLFVYNWFVVLVLSVLFGLCWIEVLYCLHVFCLFGVGFVWVLC